MGLFPQALTDYFIISLHLMSYQVSSVVSPTWLGCNMASPCICPCRITTMHLLYRFVELGHTYAPIVCPGSFLFHSLSTLFCCCLTLHSSNSRKIDLYCKHCLINEHFLLIKINVQFYTIQPFFTARHEKNYWSQVILYLLLCIWFVKLCWCYLAVSLNLLNIFFTECMIAQ